MLFSPKDNYHRGFALAWLGLALGAMGISTLYAVLLVLARMPGSQSLFAGVGMFQKALVAHVDFAVLIWLLACAGLLWSLSCGKSKGVLDAVAPITAAFGAVLVAMAPFAGTAPVVMSNYVPVLDAPLFLTGLALFFAGVVLQALRMVVQNPFGGGALRPGVFAAALAVIAAALVLLWAYLHLPLESKPNVYYEGLFWGAGHVLQSGHSLLLMVAWLWLLADSGLALPLRPSMVTALFAIGVAPVLLAPVLMATLDGLDDSYWRMIPLLKGISTSLILLPLGGVVLWVLLREKLRGVRTQRLPASLWLSLLLLLIGLGLAALIRADNLMVTAHYHGVNAAVTLAFMGMIFRLLPRLGFADPSVWRMARLQPYLYALGMLLYIMGMAWSGLLDLPRKTAGAAQGVDTLAEQAAMGLMGLGGLIAIVASAIFVVFGLRAFWSRRGRLQSLDTK